MAQKERQFEQALLLKHGVRFEAVADDGVVVHGQSVKITMTVDSAPLLSTCGAAPSVAGFHRCGLWLLRRGSRREDTLRHAGQRRAVSRQCVLAPRSDAERYDFDPDVPFGVPFRPSPFRASVEVALEAEAITIDRPIEDRYGDIVAGEKRMEVTVVPAFGIAVAPSIVVVPRAAPGGKPEPRVLRVAVTNNTEAARRAASASKRPRAGR